MIIDRPGVAGAVLQTPSTLIHSLIQSLILCETVYTTKEVDTGSLLTVPSVL
jgi:hypothetical protein